MVRIVVAVVAVIAFTFGAAAGLNAWLGDNGDTGSASNARSSLAAADPDPSHAPLLGSPERPIAISETEYTVKSATKTLSPGKYSFRVKNMGTIEHAINFDGPNLEDASTGALRPGASGDLTFTLVAGTYRVYCPMPKHKGMGMETTIKVG